MTDTVYQLGDVHGLPKGWFVFDPKARAFREMPMHPHYENERWGIISRDRLSSSPVEQVIDGGMSILDTMPLAEWVEEYADD